MLKIEDMVENKEKKQLKVDVFWKIPEQIFTIRDDYEIYMRHYTEGTDETVMFFIPKET